jgi:hypothetical protein
MEVIKETFAQVELGKDEPHYLTRVGRTCLQTAKTLNSMEASAMQERARLIGSRGRASY